MRRRALTAVRGGGPVSAREEAGGPRVLVLVDQLRRRVPGGIGTSILGLLKGLTELQDTGGASVTLYAGRAPRGSDPLVELGWPLLSSPWPSPVMTRVWARGFVDVPSGFDVVHAQSLAAPPGRGRKLVVTIHDLTWRQFPEAFTRRGRRWHERALGRALARADAFVVSSEPVMWELVAIGAPQEMVSVIPLGCDHLPAPDVARASELLGRLGVRGEYLLSVCTLEPRKNLSRLIEAYRLARDRLPQPWPLVVVGPSGWGRGRSGGVVRSPGVVLAGKVGSAELAGLYRRARLLAYVPLVEGFGLPPVEAMREGIPVVASAVPSVDGAAMQVDPLRVDEIAQALVTTALDDTVRATLVEAGRVRAAQLVWAETARRHLELWESLG